jgi:exodeoxyribonuclease V
VPTFELSNEQEQCVKDIKHWRRNKTKPWYLVSGPAGCGKTELVKEVLQTVKGEVILAGPTGKSALIMSQRTKLPAQTIHSLIYKPAGSGGSREAIERLKEELKVVGESSARGQVLSRELKKLLSEVKPLFNLNVDSALKNAALLVVDEMSMVPEYVIQDLLSFNVPVLFQGDFHQLKPVCSKPFFTPKDTDFELTQVHRQAKDSPIIYLATLAREGKPLPLGKHGDSVVTREVSVEEAMSHDQIIVGKNKTRHATNAKVRHILGRQSQLPEPEDRVMCLHNNAKAGLMNGQQFIVTSFNDIDRTTCTLGIKGDDLNTRFVAHKHYFLEQEPEPWHKQAAENFGYSYAATCHKMQGDQAESVYVLDQSRCFPGQEKAWLYTAATRSQKRLTIKLI